MREKPVAGFAKARLTANVVEPQHEIYLLVIYVRHFEASCSDIFRFKIADATSFAGQPIRVDGISLDCGAGCGNSPCNVTLSSWLVGMRDCSNPSLMRRRSSR